jgi:hypothetical protein
MWVTWRGAFDPISFLIQEASLVGGRDREKIIPGKELFLFFPENNLFSTKWR